MFVIWAVPTITTFALSETWVVSSLKQGKTFLSKPVRSIVAPSVIEMLCPQWGSPVAPTVGIVPAAALRSPLTHIFLRSSAVRGLGRRSTLVLSPRGRWVSVDLGFPPSIS